MDVGANLDTNNGANQGFCITQKDFGFRGICGIVEDNAFKSKSLCENVFNVCTSAGFFQDFYSFYFDDSEAHFKKLPSRTSTTRTSTDVATEDLKLKLQSDSFTTSTIREIRVYRYKNNVMVNCVSNVCQIHAPTGATNLTVPLVSTFAEDTPLYITTSSTAHSKILPIPPTAPVIPSILVTPDNNSYLPTATLPLELDASDHSCRFYGNLTYNGNNLSLIHI